MNPNANGMHRFSKVNLRLNTIVDAVEEQIANERFTVQEMNLSMVTNKNPFRVPVDALCKDDTGEISRDPRTKRLFAEHLQIHRRCARTSSDRFFLAGSHYGRSWSSSMVDTEQRHHTSTFPVYYGMGFLSSVSVQQFFFMSCISEQCPVK